MTNFYESEQELLSEKVIERVKRLNTSLLGDAMGRSGAMDYTIKPVSPDMKIIGTAMTVMMRAGDNLFLHKAISIAGQGYVLVADGKGHIENAYLGELMAETAKLQGLEGIVIDGLVRDKEELIELDFPIYTKGFTPNGPHKDGPGEINTPISCGGVTVHPGDLVVGDSDGVVIVPRNKIEEVITNAEKKLEYENRRKLEIRKGELEPSWLKSTMETFK